MILNLMKTAAVVCAIIFTTSNSMADVSHGTSEEIFGARFKEGKGVELSELTKVSLGVETIEVGENSFDDGVVIDFQVLSAEPPKLMAIIGKNLAASLNEGDSILIGDSSGQILSLTQSSLSGDRELVVSLQKFDRQLNMGDAISALLKFGKKEMVTAVPSTSLLQTVSGTFVYVVNGKHFLRTEVKIGRVGNSLTEITEGLYPGDEVVKTSVDLLWYVELQAIRGGVGCADGH